MSKTLYEEALADVKQLKEVAESNVRRAVMDSVTPKIKELIEAQLFGEQVDGEIEEAEELDEIGGLGSTALGVTHPAVASGPASTPAESDKESPEGDVTEGYELTTESANSLAQLGGVSLSERAEVSVFRLVEATNNLVVTPTQKKLSDEYSRKIVETIQRIEDTYSYLREASDFSRKSELETKLEGCFEVLSAVKESTMRMKDLLSRKSLMEDMDMDAGAGADPMADAGAPPPAGPAAGGKELVMKVTGLPDDVELDKLNIDLISDEGDEMAGAEGGAPELAAGPTPEEAPMESYDMEENDMLEAEEMDEEGLDEVELSELDEDDVVEISETMLKKELARLKGGNLNEMDADILSDFGGGKDEGEAFLDGEVSTADKDNMVKQSGKPGTTDKVKTPPKGRVAEAKAAIAARKAGKVTESAKNADFKQLAESRAATIESLRKQLTETNLLSAKLLQANKLLQLEGLTAEQKAQVIDRLDEAESLREVKLVYETLVRAFVGKKKTVSESTASRAVIAGSSSRTMTRSSAAPTQTSGDSYETARWAELAGIKRK
jgi:hypothetical protein